MTLVQPGLVGGGEGSERQRRPVAVPPVSRCNAHVVHAARGALDVEHHMAGERAAVAGDEVPRDVVERRAVAVRELRRALAAPLDGMARREVWRPTGVDPHPVRLPAVLEPEPAQALAETLVRSQRPAAHFADAVIDGRPHRGLEVRVRNRERQRRVGRAEQQRDAVELDLLAAAPEPRPVVPLHVLQHDSTIRAPRASSP